MNSNDLWILCNKYGKVADVYIAKKLSKMDKRFAFVRFLNVINIDSLEQSLASIWIGNHHVFASLARFGRNSQSQNSKHIFKESISKGLHSNAHVNRKTYVSVAQDSNNRVANKPDRNFSLLDSDICSYDDASCMVMAKVRNPIHIPYLRRMWSAEGFEHFKINYMGGSWVWIEFQNEETCMQFKCNKAIKSTIKEFTMVTGTFTLTERAVWVEVIGLPMCAWTPSAYKKVASIFGEILFLDNDPDEQKGSGKVCINSKVLDFIHDRVSVTVNGRDYSVLIKEIANWSPSILKSEEASPSASEEPSPSTSECESIDGTESDENKDVLSNGSTTNIPDVNLNPDNNTTIAADKSISNENEHVGDEKVRDEKSSNAAKHNDGDSVDTTSKPPGFNEETNLTQVDLLAVKAMWGNFQFEVASSSARGNSGGILTIWDPAIFSCTTTLVTDNVLIVEGNWAVNNVKCFLLNVYAPQSTQNKKEIWNFILSFMQNHVGEYIVFGDFNVVRFAHERQGTVFCQNMANDFNQFITAADLSDIPMGGRTFTRMNKQCTKFSKLDRFLVTNGILEQFPSLHGRILSNIWSDHNLILLKNEVLYYGPTPFKLFDSWLEHDGFDNIVWDAWNEPAFTSEVNKFIVFKNKLKNVKAKLKDWIKTEISKRNGTKASLLHNLESIERQLATEGAILKILLLKEWIF
ncbi:RNA-directed DNA polymerase, eukaryota [Tanacetum coccineum]